LEKTFTGLIISTQLAEMSNKRYGFISIETDNKDHYKIKISAFTKHETLDVGERVSIVGESLGNQGVWTAKIITRTS
jgi:cold shock CspA family protein